MHPLVVWGWGRLYEHAHRDVHASSSSCGRPVRTDVALMVVCSVVVIVERLGNLVGGAGGQNLFGVIHRL